MHNAYFSPISVGELELANRIVMGPMTRSRSDEAGCVPSFAADYYAQRADAGLIISEATNISPFAVGYALTPGIWTPEQVEAWKPVTHAVHEAGGRFVLQLWHTGRLSHPDLHNGEPAVAPSAITPAGQAFLTSGMADYLEPRALETAEIPRIVEEYHHAAENAKAAGFDGVEVHSANNYLLEQFLRDSTNRREDEYGGSIENRLRFPLAAVAAAVDVWGAGRVGVRVSPATTQPGDTPLDSDTMATYTTYLSRLAELDLAYTHVIEGVTQMKREWPEEVDFEEFRRLSPGAYVANNKLTVEDGAARLEAGEADLIAFARPFIANPDLVLRIRDGGPWAMSPQEYWYGGGSEGYSDWPTMARAAV